MKEFYRSFGPPGILAFLSAFAAIGTLEGVWLWWATEQSGKDFNKAILGWGIGTAFILVCVCVGFAVLADEYKNKFSK